MAKYFQNPLANLQITSVLKNIYIRFRRVWKFKILVSDKKIYFGSLSIKFCVCVGVCMYKTPYI